MKAKQRGKKGTYKCACCGDLFEARVADRKRGWARFCSKSCKAKKQEQRTGQYAAFKNRQRIGCGIADVYDVDISDSDFGASDGGSC